MSATKKPAKLATDSKADVVYLTRRSCGCGCGERIPANKVVTVKRITYKGNCGTSNMRLVHFVAGHEARAAAV